MDSYLSDPEYLKHDGNVCPSCKRTICIARKGEPPESGLKRVRSAECLICNARWQELWMRDNPSEPLRLAGYQNLKIFPDSLENA